MPGQGAPPGGGAPPPGQATGNMPATVPGPNRGIEAAAQARLAVYVQGLTRMLPEIPPGSDLAKDIREAVNKLAKHVPPGEVSQGIQMTEAQRQLLQQRQMSPQIAAMRAMGGLSNPAAPPPQMQA